MNKKTEKIDENKELLEMIERLGDKFGPMLLKNKELNAPIIKRQQWMNFGIMSIICVGVVWLAYSKVIDSSAATGLIGAVIGYVFGHIYQKKEQ